MDVLFTFSIILSVIGVTLLAYLFSFKIFLFSIYQILKTIKEATFHPNKINSVIIILFFLIFLTLPLFWGLTFFLQSDGNVIVVLFTIAWIYNWIKYTYLAHQIRLDAIVLHSHPFFEKFPVSNNIIDEEKFIQYLKQIQSEYKLSNEALRSIFSQNPYWQKVCGYEFFDKELLPESLITKLTETSEDKSSDKDREENSFSNKKSNKLQKRKN